MALASGCLLCLHTASGQQVAEAAEPKTATSEPVGRLVAPLSGPDFRGGEASESPPPSGGDEPLWQMLRDFYPERVRELNELREKDPHKFAQVERRMRPWLGELARARSQNPELAQLMVRQHRNEMAIHDWQNRYAASKDEQRKSLLEEGRQLAQTRVDLRQQRDKLRIQLIEKRLHELKTELREREVSKDTIVDHEFEQMRNPHVGPSPSSQPAP
jgi:hypothetical protein